MSCNQHPPTCVGKLLKPPELPLDELPVLPVLPELVLPELVELLLGLLATLPFMLTSWNACTADTAIRTASTKTKIICFSILNILLLALAV